MFRCREGEKNVLIAAPHGLEHSSLVVWMKSCIVSPGGCGSRVNKAVTAVMRLSPHAEHVTGCTKELSQRLLHSRMHECLMHEQVSMDKASRAPATCSYNTCTLSYDVFLSHYMQMWRTRPWQLSKHVMATRIHVMQLCMPMTSSSQHCSLTQYNWFVERDRCDACPT